MNICIYDHIYGLVGKKCHKGDKCKIAAGVVMAKLVVVIQSAARRSQCRQQKIPVLAAVIAVVLIADAAGVRDENTKRNSPGLSPKSSSRLGF